MRLLLALGLGFGFGLGSGSGFGLPQTSGAGRRPGSVMERDEALALAQRALPGREVVDVTGIETVASLWAGMGAIYGVRATCADGDGEAEVICKRIALPAGELSVGDARKAASYEVEAAFYEGVAELLNGEAGCAVPQGLLVERGRGAEGLTICMTRLPGSVPGGLGRDGALRAAAWAARLHAFTWGAARADEFVRMGLQPQGSYWYLDTRLDEWEAIPRRGWQARLRRAARAVDERLKADPLCCVVHGDFKAGNMVWDGDDVAMCDFQYCGKGCALKDLAYMIGCYLDDRGARRGTPTHPLERDVLEAYRAELAARLGEDAAPPQAAMDAALDLCFLDLYRWMAGWGVWGNAFLEPRAQSVLDRIDGGKLLKDEDAYRQAVQRAFPL
uniref:Aminoglycoside phosphotransferase domain-containing protein n=1 Tax=Phaeomonas parva TaxID=124430 RepID=A0A7S1U035_9STRA|mmetsp:Transcript_22908/g.71146  ORF Transcript_22908/g.71146 Transcript_22908/m.71146 type:complete len:388 (+) Transcript_22908:283-1446(+)